MTFTVSLIVVRSIPFGFRSQFPLFFALRIHAIGFYVVFSESMFYYTTCSVLIGCSWSFAISKQVWHICIIFTIKKIEPHEKKGQLGTLAPDSLSTKRPEPSKVLFKKFCSTHKLSKSEKKNSSILQAKNCLFFREI